MAASQATGVYSRKEKSLGELCRRFLHHYGIQGKGILLLDACTQELGVERRRIYDIINILESFCVIRRRAKNEYQWRGLYKILESIQAQITEGLVSSHKKCSPRLQAQSTQLRQQLEAQGMGDTIQTNSAVHLGLPAALAGREGDSAVQNSNWEPSTGQCLNQGFKFDKKSYKIVEVPSDDEDRSLCKKPQGKRQTQYKKVKSLGSFC